MFKKVYVVVLLLSVSAFASDSQTPAQHAAATVAHLHDTMLDPASFVLDRVFITKANRRGNVSVCYAFRSHNRMGGYSAGRAVEDGDDHNRLSIYTTDNGAGLFPGYDVGWVAPCKDKNIDREITAGVAALAPALYEKSR
jgi:hypothetical protein